MKALTANQIIRILEANNFKIVRQRGSHVIFKHQTTGQIVPVPLHGGNKQLHAGSFLVIFKQSGLNPVIFHNK
jgi:predicted RNA binding protein YcfA (HicA-like mRNA interferase family)